MLMRESSTIPGYTAKITDFGLARSFQLQSRIQTQMYGTVRQYSQTSFICVLLIHANYVIEETGLKFFNRAHMWVWLGF